MRIWIFTIVLLVAMAVLLEVSAKKSSRDVESMKPKKEKLKETVANRRSKDRSAKIGKKGKEEFVKGKERKRRSFDEDSFKEFSRDGKRNFNTADKNSKLDQSRLEKRQQNVDENDLKQYYEKLGKSRGSEKKVGSTTQSQRKSKRYAPNKRSEQILNDSFDDTEDITLDRQLSDINLSLEEISKKGREDLEVEKKIEKTSPGRKSQILSEIENISEEEPSRCSKYSKEQNKREKFKDTEVKSVGNFEKVESVELVDTTSEFGKEKHPKIDNSFQEYTVKDTGLEEQNAEKKGFKKLSQDSSCKVNDKLEASEIKVQKKCEQYKRSECDSDSVRIENRNSKSNDENINAKDVAIEGQQTIQKADEMKKSNNETYRSDSKQIE